MIRRAGKSAYVLPMALASSKIWKRLVRDESGIEIVEIALLLGRIACACIFLVNALGIKGVGRWDPVHGIFGDV